MKLPRALTRDHVAEDARLLADRYELVSCLDVPRSGRIAEIGVANGAFSRFLIDTFAPARFDAFDLFRLHELPAVWGIPTTEIFRGETHREYFDGRFSSEIAAGQVHIFEGDSSVNLKAIQSKSYDFIYVDGDHKYDGVLKDALEAVRLIKPAGAIVFNDYTLFDHSGGQYGIVQVVNDICYQFNLEITHFALQQGMFCDVALKRKTADE